MCPFCIASAMLAVGGMAAGGGLTVLAGKFLRLPGKRETEAVRGQNSRTQLQRIGQPAKTA
jgi:hypothetical protein